MRLFFSISSVTYAIVCGKSITIVISRPVPGSGMPQGCGSGLRSKGRPSRGRMRSATVPRSSGMLTPLRSGGREPFEKAANSSGHSPGPFGGFRSPMEVLQADVLLAIPIGRDDVHAVRLPSDDRVAEAREL